MEKKLLLTTYKKLASVFQNPGLFWSPCQPGWAKRYTVETASSIKLKKLVLKTVQFLNHCRSRINHIKQQKLALPIIINVQYPPLWTLTTDVSWYCKLSKSQLGISSLQNNIQNRIIQVRSHKLKSLVILWLESAFIEQNTNYPVIQWRFIPDLSKASKFALKPGMHCIGDTQF